LESPLFVLFAAEAGVLEVDLLFDGAEIASAELFDLFDLMLSSQA
jgi:hypothetical protein